MWLLYSLSLLLSLGSMYTSPIGFPLNIPWPFVSVPNYPFVHSHPQFWRTIEPPKLQQDPAGSKHCLTKGCVNAASDMIRNMDETADPCTDFYQFACGGFIKETVIPEHKTVVWGLSNLDDKLNKQMLKLFEGDNTELGEMSSQPHIYTSVKNL